MHHARCGITHSAARGQRRAWVALAQPGSKQSRCARLENLRGPVGSPSARRTSAGHPLRQHVGKPSTGASTNRSASGEPSPRAGLPGNTSRAAARPPAQSRAGDISPVDSTVNAPASSPRINQRNVGVPAAIRQRRPQPVEAPFDGIGSHRQQHGQADRAVGGARARAEVPASASHTAWGPSKSAWPGQPLPPPSRWRSPRSEPGQGPWGRRPPNSRSGRCGLAGDSSAPTQPTAPGRTGQHS